MSSCSDPEGRSSSSRHVWFRHFFFARSKFQKRQIVYRISFVVWFSLTNKLWWSGSYAFHSGGRKFHFSYIYKSHLKIMFLKKKNYHWKKKKMFVCLSLVRFFWVCPTKLSFSPYLSDDALGHLFPMTFPLWENAKMTIGSCKSATEIAFRVIAIW